MSRDLEGIEERERPWYTDHARLSDLARWLIKRDELPLDEVPYYLEKPWKWEREYEQMCREQDRDVCAIGGCAKEAAETKSGKRFCAKHAAERNAL